MDNCNNCNNSCGEMVTPSNNGKLYGRFCNFSHLEKYDCPCEITPPRLRLGTPYNGLINRPIPPGNYSLYYCTGTQNQK